MKSLRQSFCDGSLNRNCAQCDNYYRPAAFHSSEMRAMAKVTRRRLGGEIVRHAEPLEAEWQME
jgi:hypothetical protein